MCVCGQNLDLSTSHIHVTYTQRGECNRKSGMAKKSNTRSVLKPKAKRTLMPPVGNALILVSVQYIP